MGYTANINDVQEAFDNLTISEQKQFIIHNLDIPNINNIIDYLTTIDYKVS